MSPEVLEPRSSPSGWTAAFEGALGVVQQPFAQQVGLYQQYEQQGVLSPAAWFDPARQGGAIAAPPFSPQDQPISIGHDAAWYGALGAYYDQLQVDIYGFASGFVQLAQSGQLDQGDIDTGWAVYGQMVLMEQQSYLYLLAFAEQQAAINNPAAYGVSPGAAT